VGSKWLQRQRWVIGGGFRLAAGTPEDYVLSEREPALVAKLSKAWDLALWHLDCRCNRVRDKKQAVAGLGCAVILSCEPL
jgi:hypothetical protein